MRTLTLTEERPSSMLKSVDLRSGEAVAFCPQCKAFQTVWINDNKLMPTRKFFQEGSLIYHDCGSVQPCRVYYSW